VSGRGEILPGLAHLNALDADAARAALARCCGSTRWVDAMLAARPFESAAALFARAEAEWSRLSEVDYLEAFSHHPQIGEDLGRLRERFAGSLELSGREQAAVSGADQATLLALRDDNRAYRERFGFVFIVCATGKSAAEMLGLLRERLRNDRSRELGIAAAEQAEITRLRLGKMLS
jgi:2-oxo-4-hydroxy-4-carboxy-5-ureidoimidazoline decarboxylase